VKKFVFLLSLTVALFFSVNVIAAESKLPSCDDLADIADSLDDVAESLSKTGKIEKESKTDKMLGKLVDELEKIADIEQNEALDKGVDTLGKAWDKMDWEKFKLALDSVIANFDRIRRKDCKEKD